MFKGRNKRETGFEILRILAMFFIMVVHLLNAGGVLDNAIEGTIVWHRLLYTLFIPAVNVFVLVSAYFMVSSTKLKVKKLVYLWCEVVFYCVVTYLISSLFIYDNFSGWKLVGCFFPITTCKYWFFSSYFLLMLASPFLNKILNNSTKKSLYLLCLVLFVLSYLYMKQPIGSILNLSFGYSIWWHVSLYIFAGTLKLYPPNIKKRYLFIVYLMSIVLLWGFSLMHTSNYWIKLIYNTLDYTSPLVTIASISLLLLFKNVNFKNNYLHNIICYVASLTFAVYIIEGSFLHEIWRFKVFKIQNWYASPFSPIGVLLVALETFIFCAVIEACRKSIVALFRKILIRHKAKKKQSIIEASN